MRIGAREESMHRQGQGTGAKRRSLLEQVGWKGLLAVVWHATPIALRLLALPYGLVVYGRLLAYSENLDDLYLYHIEKYRSSRFFKLLRPRYHVLCHLLNAFAKGAGVSRKTGCPLN